MNYFEVRREWAGINSSGGGGGDVDGWWTDDAIAAYQFKGAATLTQALRDRTGNGYNLVRQHMGPSSNPQWSSANGISFPVNSWLKNLDLDARQDIKTIIIRYADMQLYSRLSYAKGAQDSYVLYNPSLCYGARFITQSAWEYTDKPVVMVDLQMKRQVYHFDDGEPDIPILTYYEGPNAVDSSGVLACTPKKLFFNGQNVNAVKKTIELGIGTYTQYGSGTMTLQGDNGTLVAAAFYDKVLTDSKIEDISLAMLEI